MNSTHLTSAHTRHDTRIFYKMCRSLVASGHQVNLVVADGMGNEKLHGVCIFDAGASNSRFDRIFNAPARVLSQALALDADVYHLHDPELIPIGIKLKHRGKRVVFDSHEDVPKQILGKPYLSKPLLWLLSKSYGIFESWACKRFDGVIAATPFIKDKFLPVNSNTVDINNFPILGELTSTIPWQDKRDEVCYVGGIAKIRGIYEMCFAIDQAQSGVRLNLCGDFVQSDLEKKVKATSGWRRVNEFGYVDRDGVRDVLQRSMAGLVTLHPVDNYIDSLPVKMFEYMSAGIPVIASDFPVWREIIEGCNCGICVDPGDPADIARAIDFFVQNPDRAKLMGENGRRAVQLHFNWSAEEAKLLRFYDLLLTQKVS